MLLSKALRSSTYRFALTCIGAFGFIVLALLGNVYVSTVSYVEDTLDRGIETEQKALLKAHSSVQLGGLRALINERADEEGFTGAIYSLSDATFRPLAGNLKVWPTELRRASQPTTLFWDGATIRASVVPAPGGTHLLIARRADRIDVFTERLRTAFLLSIGFIFLLAGGASIAVTRRTVGRIEAINAMTREIMRSGLNERIPLRGTHDEWDQLSENLNAMLDRIAALIDEVKTVSDNVAHDLRTPLARIRGRLETARDDARNGTADQALIERTLSDLDDVLRMFTALTRIAGIEANALAMTEPNVDLSLLASDVVELFEPASEQKEVRLTVGGQSGVFVAGDRDLLFDAVSNLVDNAIKHGRKDGRVHVDVGTEGGRPFIAVSDNGPGIPAAEFSRVLKRFYRLESSRHTSGNGLGLSLVSAVAKFHGVTIDMADKAPGLQISLRFLENASLSKNG